MVNDEHPIAIWPRDWGPPPEHGWVCFHCGACLTTAHEARDHFGPTQFEGEEIPPACIRLASRLMRLGFREGYSPNITVNLRDLEQDDTLERITMADEQVDKEKGQIAYEAYREACPVSKFTGDKLPLWANIDPELKPYWSAVEDGVLAHYAGFVRED